MVIIKPIDGVRASKQIGKIGNYAEFGRIFYGHAQYGKSFEEAGIYQMRKCKIGYPTEGTKYHYAKLPIRMKFYEPTNKQTEKQQANRQKFADAIEAYQNLTDEEKQVYYNQAIGQKKSGYNIYLTKYMLS